MRRLSLLPVIASALACAAPVAADTQPIANTPDLPWTNPAHTGNLEVLAGQITSTIAGHTVSVRCEGATDWQTLALQRRFDPNLELGYVSFTPVPGGSPVISDFTELAGQTVCLPLKNFAVATTKPTKCSPPSPKTRLAGKKKVATPVASPVPCYLGNLRSATKMPASYWDAYGAYAQAIETLGHEATHLSGITNESVAECSGMQWMQRVAEALGDTPDDAESIAQFFWDNIYPFEKTDAPAYWSADCKPGGALDVRPAGKTSWP